MTYYDAFMIVKNERRLVEHALDTLVHIHRGVGLGALSIIDNGSTDGTLDVIHEYRYSLPLRVRSIPDDPRHGYLRTEAIRGLSGKWIIYLDADETFTSGIVKTLAFWQKAGSPGIDVVGFPRLWTIKDRYHVVRGVKEAFQCRMFRNYDGVHFPQKIHTEPTYSYGSGLARATTFHNVTLFDHSNCKSDEELLEKGDRYQWAVGEPYIGDRETWLRAKREAIANNAIDEVDPEIRRDILFGPVEEKAA